MAHPSVADVRVSCPACGGPIHPIAGRCKHCRTDLVAARGGATGAQGTMIQIGQLGARGKVVAPASPSTSAASTPLITPMKQAGSPTAAPAVGPLAPVAARPRNGLARRWAVVVAAVAAIAIVASIVVLIAGGDGKGKRKRRSLGPAPDRMQTDQLPTDPWARPGSGSAPDPSHGQLLPGAQAPDLGGPPDDPPRPTLDDDDDDDGVAGGVLGGAPIPAAETPEDFLRGAVDVTCRRLQACWGDDNAQALCDEGRRRMRQIGPAVLDTLCARVDQGVARQCLSQVATLPCPDQAATIEDVITMVYGLDPCMRACESP